VVVTRHDTDCGASLLVLLHLTHLSYLTSVTRALEPEDPDNNSTVSEELEGTREVRVPD
jgi:hypothetical protein